MCSAKEAVLASCRRSARLLPARMVAMTILWRILVLSTQIRGYRESHRANAIRLTARQGRRSMELSIRDPKAARQVNGRGVVSKVNK